MPLIGSRSIGRSVGLGDGLTPNDRPPETVTFPSFEPESLPYLRKRSPPPVLNRDANYPIGDTLAAVLEESTEKGDFQEEKSDVISKLDLSRDEGNSSPCALLSPIGTAGGLSSYQEKPLITVSHELFEVSYGVVPDVMYKGMENMF